MGISVYAKVVLNPLERAAEEALKNLPDEESEEEPTSIFIPFPGTTKQLPITPYRGSDPEWQEFINFSKDQAAGKKVRGGLQFKDIGAGLTSLQMTWHKLYGKLRIRTRLCRCALGVG